MVKQGCVKRHFRSVSILISSIFIALIFAGSASAESLLWRIEKKDAPVSYLYGTVHIGKVGSRLAGNIHTYLDSADALMLEGDVLGTNLNASELQALVLAMVDQTLSLDKKLGANYFNAVYNIVTKEDKEMTKEALKAIQPWAVLTMIMYSTPDGYSPLYGKDIMLAMAAEELYKKQYHLESIAEATGYFTRLPEQRAIEFVRTYIDNKAQYEQDVLKLVQYHDENNVKELLKYIDISLSKLREADDKFWARWYDTLIDTRTSNWIPRITQRLPSESIFIAVGAAHLYGEKGLVKRLRAEGYKLTPIKP